MFCLRVSVLSVHVADEKANDPQWANISLQRHFCHAKVKLFARRERFFYVMSCGEGGVVSGQCSVAETILTSPPFLLPPGAWSKLCASAGINGILNKVSTVSR